MPDKRLVYRELDDEILESYDEIFLNMVSIEKNAFVDLTNLKSLHLRFKKILDIDLEHMINLRELRLESNPVIDTLMLPPNLEKLTIIGLPIRLESITNLTNLISLELEYITDLFVTNSKPFACLRKLKQLSIKNSRLFFQVSDFKTNKIELGSEEIEDLTLYDNTYKFNKSSRSKTDIKLMIYFENFPNLKKLSLFLSYRNSIDIVSFRKLTNLECLEFSVDSSIMRQEGMKGLLNNFTKLKKVKLQDISHIDESSFLSLVNLESLELPYRFRPNYMKRSISCNTFSNFNNLTHLDWGDSFRLENLDTSLFKCIHNLESFAVSEVKKIQDGAFINLNKLKKLTLDSCGLIKITVHTFQGLCSLEELNLSSNKLESIEARSFDHVKTLKNLNLG